MNVLAKLSYIVFVGTNIMEQKVTGRIIDLNCVIPCSYQVPTKSLPDMAPTNPQNRNQMQQPFHAGSCSHNRKKTINTIQGDLQALVNIIQFS